MSFGLTLSDITSLISAVAALGAVVVSAINSRKINAVHVDINSRMSQLLEVSGNAAHAEGVMQGRKDQRAEGER